MRVVQGCLLGIAVFQILSTLLGAVELLVAPQWFAPLLDDTVFAGRYVLAALLLGVVVGGFQWAAVVVHLRMRRWLPLGHALAGTVMTGWIAGECLVLDSFMWPTRCGAAWGSCSCCWSWCSSVSCGLRVRKLVEPTRDEGAGRVETVVGVSKVLGLGLFVGCWVVSTRVVRSSRPGSTGFMKTHPQVLSHPFCALRAREGSAA